MKVSDLILGPLVTAIGLLALFAARLQPKPFFGGGYGGGLFPGIIGCGLVLAGLLLAAQGWRSRGSAPLVVFGGWVRSARHIGNGAVVLGSLLFYILFSDWLGFIPACFLVVLANLFRFTRRAGLSVLVALVTTLAVKIGFQDILRVPLPWGVLEPYAGVLTWR